MHNCITTFTLLLIYLNTFGGSIKFNNKLDEYLRTQSMSLQSGEYKRIKKWDKNEVIILNYSKNESFSMDNRTIHSFKAFDYTCIFSNTNLFCSSLNGWSLSRNMANMFEFSSDVKFVKAHELKNFGLATIVLKNGTIQLYNFNTEMKFTHIQSISHFDVSSLQFMTEQDNVYLIVASNKKNHVHGNLIIYKWTGTHFDETTKLLTKETTIVKTFKTESSEIIILQEEKKYVSIYEFEYEKLRKMQRIIATNPRDISIYSTGSKNFMGIFEESGHNKIFYWTGVHFRLLHSFATFREIISSTIIYENGAAYLILFDNEEITALNIQEKEIVAQKRYGLIFSQIVEIQFNNDANSNGGFIIYLENNEAKISFVTINIQYKGKDHNNANLNYLGNCLGELKSVLNLKMYGRKKNTENDTLSLPIKSRNTDSAHVNILSAKLTTEPERIMSDLKISMDDLKTKLVFVKETVNNYINKHNNLIIKGQTLLKGILKSKTIDMRNMDVDILNDNKWTPNEWLLYNTDQTITGHLTAENATIKDFNIVSNSNIFSDLLLKHNDNKIIITGPITVEDVIVNELKTNTINNMFVNDMYIRNSENVIDGVKFFNNIYINQARINTLNRESPDSMLYLFTDSKLKDFDPKLEIENLWTSEIDNINWNEFKDSVFRIGNSQIIKGDLIFSKLMTDKLKLKTISGENVDDILTTSTDQTVKSTVRFRSVFTNDAKVDNINNVPFDNFVIIDPQETPSVKGLVRIDKMVVNKKLELIGDFADVYMKDGARIIGTNESDLVQMYNSDVYIKGNLYVNNINLWDSSRLFLSDDHFDLNYKKYWTKKTNQKINVHIEAKKGLSTTSLQANFINGISPNMIMLNTQDQHGKTNFVFENVTISGNLLLNENEVHTPDFHKIDTQGVKINGSFVINGEKTYANKLRIENLTTNNLGGINSLKVLTKKHSGKVTGTKTFENVVVQENLNFDALNLHTVNNISINTLFNNVILLSSSENFTNINFESISVSNLNTKNINGHSVDKHIKNVEGVYKNKAIQHFYINGDANIDRLTNVSKINGITFTDLYKNHASRKTFSKPVKFFDSVKIKHLIVKIINDVDFESLTNRMFYKNGDQQLDASYTFNNLKTENMYVSKINNISFKDVIDFMGNLQITADLKIMNSNLTSLQANVLHPCDISQIMENINNPTPQLWMNMNVLGNVTFLDEDSPISRILRKSVKKNDSNIINAEVRFNSHVAAKNVETTNKKINNVDLKVILEDSLKKKSDTEQVITGRNIFPQAYLSSGIVEGNADIPVVNDILISELNSRIVSKTSDTMTITGKKVFFGGLQANRIYSGIVSKIPPENMVNFLNLNATASGTFESIEINNNLFVENINNVNLDSVLKNKLRTNTNETQFTNATYFFDKIEIADHLTTNSINDVEITNIVVDVGIQDLRSQKIFTNDLVIIGNAHIDYINGVQVSETYEKLLLFSEPGNIKGSVTLMAHTQMMGNIQTKNINGHSLQNILDILSMERTQLRVNSVYTDKKAIYSTVESLLYLTQNLPSDYMYIEKSKILDIHTPNTVDTKTVETSGHVLIHITSEEDGNFCGLPNNCKCPMQQTIEMTPEHSINNFFNKGVQRIYTYDDDEMIVNVITNSISSDTECRADTSIAMKEVTSITWSTMTNANRNGSFYVFNELISGYISGVEFFIVQNTTYAVIGIYYDPLNDNHHVDSRVIRFNEDKTAATTIQYIPTKGVKSLYLFNTAQGIILIIGNKYSSDYEETEIHRFDINKQQFTLMRTISSYGCSAATGVVLNRDSLIVLAHHKEPIIILKYDPVYDNYHFYQSFHMDGPVLGVSVFYTGGFGISDAYLCIVSENEQYFIYSFQFIAGWRLECSGELEGLQKLIPFDIASQSYLLAPTERFSMLFTVVKHGLK